MKIKAITLQRGRFHTQYYNSPEETLVEESLLSKNIPVVDIRSIRDNTDNVKVPKKYLIQLFAKMRICYRINMPILQTLELCEEVIPHKKMKRILREIRERVSGGVDLATCLWSYPGVFPPVICRLVEVGYSSGKMLEICDKIFYMLSIAQQTRRKLITAMYYPAMVIIAMIFAIYILITKTIPVFTKLFSAMNVELPLPTQLLVKITDAVTGNPVLTLMSVIGIVVAILSLPKIYRMSYLFQKVVIRLYPFAALMRHSQRLMIATTLYTILDAQVPLLPALRMTRNALTNIEYKQAIASAILSVNSGKGISAGLEGYEGLMTKEFIRSLKFAEETGATVEILHSLQTEYEAGMEFQILLFREAINPIITVVIAVVVLFILLALFMPMFNLSQVIK